METDSAALMASSLVQEGVILHKVADFLAGKQEKASVSPKWVPSQASTDILLAMARSKKHAIAAQATESWNIPLVAGAPELLPVPMRGIEVSQEADDQAGPPTSARPSRKRALSEDSASPSNTSWNHMPFPPTTIPWLWRLVMLSLVREDACLLKANLQTGAVSG